MKRWLSVFLTTAMVVALFVGIGGTALASETKTLNLWHWDPAQSNAISKIIADYEAEHPDVKVEMSVIDFANYRTKLKTSIPAGTGPDIIVTGSFAAYEMIPAGLFMDLTERIAASDIDLTKMPKATLDIYTIDGHIYGIPKDYDTIGLYYNKEMFDAAGLAYPDESWTWQDLREAAKKLTIPGKQWGYISTPYSQTGIENNIFQNNGRVVDESRLKSVINSPENIETLQFFLDFITVDHSSPTGQELLEMPADQMFMAEQAAMMVGGSWAVAPVRDVLGTKFDVTHLPKGKRQATIIHGLAFAGSSKTKYPEETWNFLRMCATEKAQAYQYDCTIPGYEGSAQKWVENFPDHNVQVFIDMASYAVGDYIPVHNPGGATDAFEQEFNRIWLGEKTVEQGLADAEAAMNEAMSQ